MEKFEQYPFAPLDWVQDHVENRLFSLNVDGYLIDNLSPGLKVKNQSVKPLKEGAAQNSIQFQFKESLLIEVHMIRYPHTELIERWVSLTNIGSDEVSIQRLDSFCMSLPQDNYELMYFKSGWGAEFEPVREVLSDNKTLETRSGRSSQGMHPWFTLFRPNGQLLTGTVMWSGNWIFRFETVENGSGTVSGGLHDWEFQKQLQPGETMESVHVALAFGNNGDLNTTSIPFTLVGRTHWYPQNEFSQSLPVEWNQWWSYEDKQINEHNFKLNAETGTELGIDLCTLDAGWFGPTDPDTHWYDYRGDWDLVNTNRFPEGIRALSDQIHEKGMKFGLWCEIEALGQYSSLAAMHPAYEALRDGSGLGYVCFGNPEVQEWAFQTLDRLISDYRCDWIKLDFNLDPGAGCNRTDHGHGTGDGLYEHYQGYYKVLARIRDKHPNVVLENCSSGGLRIDLGIASQTHTTFLSDPDWPEHSLQVFWGASTMLAPEVCLHWSFSEWLGDHPQQFFNPRDPQLKQHQLDYYIRISMLHGMGISQKLPELPQWVMDRFAFHIDMYQVHIRRFIKDAVLYRLTGQPEREGKGDRWAGFQYHLSKDEHLLFVFRLSGSESKRIICLRHLDEEMTYQIIWLSEDERVEYIQGSELMQRGLAFNHLDEEDSSILLISAGAMSDRKSVV